MNLAVVGTGYVGLVSAACFAELGHTVIGVDIDEKKIEKIKRGESPIYEPGLEELLKQGLANGRLTCTTDITEALPKVDIVFSAVATPNDEDHRSDLRAVFAVAETVAKHAEKRVVFVNKSTVPVGTGKQCEEKINTILKERGMEFHIPVVSNPEFLREGLAVHDTLDPDRVVVGVNKDREAQQLMEELYGPITKTGKPLVIMTRESAEVVKYASNSFLATKISFINMMSILCEATGANVKDVAKGMGLDERIGPQFLNAGIGYGGSCFPKDVKALLTTAKEYGIPMDIISATDAINQQQRHRFLQKILDAVPAHATIAVWGLSFKPNTDDMRDAPSLDIIPALIKAGHTIRAYDPEAMERAHELLSDVTFCQNAQEAARDSDALVVLTEWDEFEDVDLHALKKTMKGNLLLDGRNMYESHEVQEADLTYIGIGL